MKKMKCCEYDLWCHIHNTLFSLQLNNEANKPVLNYRKAEKLCKFKNTLAFWPHSYVMRKMNCCEYGPRYCIHNNLFSSQLISGPNKQECYITKGWKGFARDKNSSLLGPFAISKLPRK
jgi:hypothetical protein